MLAKRAFTISALALLCFAGALLLELKKPFAYSKLRNLYRDAICRAGRTAPPNPQLVFLAIDSASAGLDETDIHELYDLPDDSTEAHALRLMSKRWPWPREVYGLVLDRLLSAGARAVAFDLTFPHPTDGDPSFRLALERHRDRVVIGSNFVSERTQEESRVRASLTRPSASLIPLQEQIDDRVGYTNFWPDDDDVVRRAQYRVVLEQLEDGWARPDTEQFESLVARVLGKAGYGQAIPIDRSEYAIRFTAPPRKGFPPRSIFEIFVPDYWKHNYQSGEFFRDKIVMVGAEGNWQHDDHTTPFGLMPGAELHLNAMNAALHGEFIREMPAPTVVFLTAAAGILAICLALFIRSPWLRLVALLVCDLSAGWIALLTFNRWSFYVPLIAPLLELNSTALFSLVGDLARERREKSHFRKTLERYVSQNVVREMLENPKSYTQSLGGTVKPATILFSDIRDFSSVTVRTDPQALVGQLNEYLTAMVECVFRFGGTLDKFAGDAVMAVWGNMRSAGIREDAANAVRSALAMRADLRRLNESWRARGLSELRVGIAIHHGEVVVGNIGSPHRMEFTVIGHAVNLSWKLQELTKQLGSALIVSEKVHSLVVEHFEMRSCGLVQVPSLGSSVELYAVTGPVELEAAQTSTLS